MKRRARALLGQIVSAGLVPVLAWMRLWRVARGGPGPMAEPQSVLLVRIDLMGDVVNGLSAAHAARQRWPSAHIAFLAPPRWRAIVDRCSAVDETIAIDPGEITHWPACLDAGRWIRVFGALRQVRARRFDVAVSIYGPIAGTVVALSGARERRGYRREAPPFSFERAFDGGRDNGGPHETELATALVEASAPTWHTVDQIGDLPMPEALEGFGRPLVVAHAGASHGDAKRWRETHWEQALKSIADEGSTVSFVGLSADAPMATRMALAVPGLIDLTGETSIELLMGTLFTADLVISTDSGPAHLARALGTRVIALHGPTDVALHGPGDPSCVALRVDIPCGPCYDFREAATCAFGDTLCMQWLAPDAVGRAARSMLATATA